MTEADINKALYSHFANYEYKLNNTYVFNWESDFFAQSKSGYFIECEIKVSRSDFFVDFKKEKHRLFQDVQAGKTHHVYRHDGYLGDGDQLRPSEWVPAMCLHGRPVDSTKPLIENTLYSRSYWSSRKPKGNTFKERKYIVNDWMQPGVKLDRSWRNAIHAPTSGIQIKKIEDCLCPHQFYYAVPEGLIILEELPKYAGLLEITAAGVKVTKRAPYLHKRNMDLSRILLKKYYNLWQYKVPYETKLAIRNNYSE